VIARDGLDERIIAESSGSGRITAYSYNRLFVSVFVSVFVSYYLFTTQHASGALGILGTQTVSVAAFQRTW
jgi:hypothetical protein